MAPLAHVALQGALSTVANVCCAIAQEAVVANGFPSETFTVVYKRPTDLALIRDVPVVCNLLLCDIMDEGERLHCHRVEQSNPPHLWTS